MRQFKDRALINPTESHMNGIVIDEVPKLLTHVPSETTHAIWVINSFNATDTINSPLRITRDISHFDVRCQLRRE